MADLLSKAVDFTNIEDVCLAVWLEAVLKGQLVVARKILQTGLLAEHYRSLLPNDVTEANPAEQALLATFRTKFQAALDEFLGSRPAPGEPAPLADAVSPEVQ